MLNQNNLTGISLHGEGNDMNEDERKNGWIPGLLNFIALLKKIIFVQGVFTKLISLKESFQIVCMWMQN